jgi:integrase
MRTKLIILPKLNRCSDNPNKQWFVYYSCRDPQSGKMIRFRDYTGFSGLTLPEKLILADQKINSLAARLRSGWSPFADDKEVIYDDHLDYKTIADMYGSRRSGNNTARVWMSKFLESIEPAVSHATYLTYQSKFRIFQLWLEKEGIENNDLTSVDQFILTRFFLYLINIKKISKVTHKKYLLNLRTFFEYAVDHKLILKNPVYDLPQCNRINDQASRPIQRADIEVFKKELMKDPELWLAIQIEFYCALRPGHEIREMKIKDIDFISGTIRVDRSRAKTRIERIVTIPRQLLLQLRDPYRLHEFDKEYFVFGRNGVPGLYCVGKNKFRNKFNVIRKRLNMPGEYKFYSWKHTGAVEADQADIPMKDISLHLGHNSLKSTDFYFRNKKSGTSIAIRENYPTL